MSRKYLRYWLPDGKQAATGYLLRRLVTPMQNSRLKTNFVVALVLLFPLLSNMLQHACTVSLLIMTLLGLPGCFSRKKRPAVLSHEKMVMWAFAAYFLVYLFVFIIHALQGSLADPRIKYIDHEARMVFIIPVFFLFRKIRLPEGVLWYSVAIGALAVGIYALIIGVLLNPGMRVFGSYHSIAFGGLSLTLAFMSLAGFHFFRLKHGWIGIVLFWCAFVAGIIACVLSGTRGAWIAVPLLTIIAFFQYYRDLRFRTWVGIFAAMVIGASVLYSIPQANIAERFHLIFEEAWAYAHGDNTTETSTSERLEGWQAAWTIITDHPFLGIGPGSFKTVVHQMIDRGERSEIIRKYHQPHSTYLAVTAACGIPGLVALLGIFLVPAVVFAKQARRIPAVRDAGFAGFYLVASFMQYALTETIFGQNLYIGFYVVMTALILHLCNGGD